MFRVNLTSETGLKQKKMNIAMRTKNVNTSEQEVTLPPPYPPYPSPLLPFHAIIPSPPHSYPIHPPPLRKKNDKNNKKNPFWNSVPTRKISQVLSPCIPGEASRPLRVGLRSRVSSLEVEGEGGRGGGGGEGGRREEVWRGRSGGGGEWG